ncbi:MAG: hypothetical protein MSIBF_07285 [Candidatus Altiarchaeales archaeon IMC4]|nr:MAG: hypothetical protein MSIBF_07285 [Candidatus Altiarchaeales archaeon IMC4]
MAQVFKTTDYTIGKLMDDIEIGDIALPDIQRPFVWYKKISKVRDLFDSIYRGYPIGYLLFWENANRSDYKNIGFDEKKRKIPRFLIIDGQQRLTALFAVMKNQEVLTPDYESKTIKIAFRPIDAIFKVGDAATDRDPEYIPDLSALWSGDGDFAIISNFISALKEKREITKEEEKTISSNIQSLININKYPLTALEIVPNLEEEIVSDIFVRINSQGVSLTQADFILTLLSVYWEEGRKEIEQFCIDSRNIPEKETRFSSFNYLIKPDPDDMLRVLVGLTFHRAKMKDVYSIIRGRDMETGEFSEELRTQQFDKLKLNLPTILDNTNWQSFLKILIGGGYKDEELISSKNAVLYSYILYLIGKQNFNTQNHELQRIIGRWFVMSSLTGRYSSSPETAFEKDLNRIKEFNPDGFISGLEKIISENLTNDFWDITLVGQMETSSARSPEANAFYAALNKLGSPVLFSRKLVGDLYDPSLKIKKKRLEKHHIFPRNHLISKYGFDKNKDKAKINQIANQTFLEFEDNIEISDDKPSEYFAIVQKRFGESEIKEMLAQHAIPENFYQLEYDDFLQERRRLMTGIIKKAFNKI